LGEKGTSETEVVKIVSCSDGDEEEKDKSEVVHKRVVKHGVVETVKLELLPVVDSGGKSDIESAFLNILYFGVDSSDLKEKLYEEKQEG
jgi:hypothetical protein